VFVGAKGATLRRSNFQTVWLHGEHLGGLAGTEGNDQGDEDGGGGPARG
jgi:hypothetical protein